MKLDKQFWSRFGLFIENIQVNDAIARPEKFAVAQENIDANRCYQCSAIITNEPEMFGLLCENCFEYDK